jgi:pyruvate dehydrogenase E2 component (dihydrolipoamide acetyltransferase)
MPIAKDDNVVISKVMYLPLTIDHWLVYGAEGQRFLNDLKHYLEDPDLSLVNMI